MMCNKKNTVNEVRKIGVQILSTKTKHSMYSSQTPRRQPHEFPAGVHTFVLSLLHNILEVVCVTGGTQQH